MVMDLSAQSGYSKNRSWQRSEAVIFNLFFVFSQHGCAAAVNQAATGRCYGTVQSRHQGHVPHVLRISVVSDTLTDDYCTCCCECEQVGASVRTCAEPEACESLRACACAILEVPD